MKISLIGMSNVGKTYWSTKIEKMGYKRIGCDDLVEIELKKMFHDPDLINISNVSEWLGQPYEKRYLKNSKIYLKIEEQVVKNFIYDIQNRILVDKNIVLDTTGSLIYLNKKVLNLLKKHTTIVLLDIPDESNKQIYERYIKNPKPLIWGNIFRKSESQTYNEALAECYPKLLKYRNTIYRNYANIKLDYRLITNPNFSTNEFLRLCRN